MCTAININHLFGRNLDNEFSFSESIAIMPRNRKISFRLQKSISSHLAIMGTAFVKDEYPLFYDAVNEKGLAIACLNFYEAEYSTRAKEGMFNIAPFELVLWVLSQCDSAEKAKVLLSKTNLININFSDELPLTPMHFIICDEKNCFVAQPIKGELKIYNNAYGVLTNSPEFPYHLFAICNYPHLSAENYRTDFSKRCKLYEYSKGMGALGLPGDFSSVSRFIKAVFLKENSQHEKKGEISHFFNLLQNVSMPSGCVKTAQGYEKTVYSCCFDLQKGIYCYKTYNSGRINCACMHHENLDSEKLIRYPFSFEEDFKFVN